MINNRQQSGNRRRGRNNNNNGPRPQGGRGDTGNRIDNRARGNAPQLLEKYKGLARDAQQAGDRVMTEYYLQFAEHYFRVVSESRNRAEEQSQSRRSQNGELGVEGQAYDADEFDGEEADEFFPPIPRHGAARQEREPRQERDGQGQREQRQDRDGQQGRESRQEREPRQDRQANRQPRGDFAREDYNSRPSRQEQPPVEDAPQSAEPDLPLTEVVEQPAPVEQPPMAASDEPRRRQLPPRRNRTAREIEGREPEAASLDASILPPAISERATPAPHAEAEPELPMPEKQVPSAPRKRGRPRKDAAVSIETSGDA